QGRGVAGLVGREQAGIQGVHVSHPWSPFPVCGRGLSPRCSRARVHCPGPFTKRGNWAGRTSAAVTRDTAGLAGCATSSPRSAVLAPMPGPGGKVTCARGQWLPGAGWAVDGRHHRALRRGPGAARPAGEGGQECGRAACDVLPPGAPGPASRAGQRIAPGLVVQGGEPRLGQGLNDGVSRHRGLLGAVDLVAVRSTCLRPRRPAVPAGRGERDCRAVLLPARSLARASALARTTSGSRGSGGSTSCHGRSRRTLGRWIRICATFLISSASHPSVGTREAGPDPGEPALRGRLRGDPVVCGDCSARDDTSRRLRRESSEGALPGGIFCDGRYHQGATGSEPGTVLGEQAQVACAATASVRLAALSLPKTWL